MSIGVRRAHRLCASVLSTVAVLVAACGSVHAPQRPDAGPTSSAAALPTLELPAPSPDPLPASFSALADDIAATIGVAVFSESGTQTLGTDPGGPAWSTIKVPLAIAALRSSGSSAEQSVAAAISQSDNGAAEELWKSLGAGSAAADAVEDVLREGGDMGTVVPTQRLRPGYTVFGQTDWGLAAQAAFAARLPCLAGAAPVLAAMRNPGGNQRWGLAGVPGAAVKGGWGPDVEGRYLVRQLAVLGGGPQGQGEVGIALVAVPDDGTFESGIDAVDRLADWVTANAARFPRAFC